MIFIVLLFVRVQLRLGGRKRVNWSDVVKKLCELFHLHWWLCVVWRRWWLVWNGQTSTSSMKEIRRDIEWMNEQSFEINMIKRGKSISCSSSASVDKLFKVSFCRSNFFQLSNPLSFALSRLIFIASCHFAFSNFQSDHTDERESEKLSHSPLAVVECQSLLGEIFLFAGSATLLGISRTWQ